MLSQKLVKTYELFISGISHLIFLECGWPQVTETIESKIADKEGLPYDENFQTGK
jgi:hypothetical protein